MSEIEIEMMKATMTHAAHTLIFRPLYNGRKYAIFCPLVIETEPVSFHERTKSWSLMDNVFFF